MKFLVILLLGVFVFANNDIITPIKKVKINKAKASLGKKLFFDTDFSSDKTISCASCHNPKEGWADRDRVSFGVGGAKGIIQSPTVLNAVFNFKQMWNGEFANLKDQINGPIHNPVEMNMTEQKVEKIINTKYKNDFKKVYGDKHYTYDMFRDAIAEFESFLTTPDSKFDLYLKGKAFLSKEEKEGYKLFIKTGCIVCHNGTNVGGNNFAKIGIYNNIATVKDRFSITGNPIDKGVYKVPTLRNIALTAPYFHNGSVKDLKQAINLMAQYNLNKSFNEKEIDYIYKFLLTLTGKQPSLKELDE